MSALRLRSKWALTSDFQPIENAYLQIETSACREELESTIAELKKGRAVNLGVITEIESSPQNQSYDFDLGSFAILPAFVNAHTHLEFSHLKEPIGSQGNSFASWVGEVIRWKIGQSKTSADPSADKRFACTRGLEEIHLSGTGTVGEIATVPDLWPMYQELANENSHPLTVFFEVLGLGEDRFRDLYEQAEAFVSRVTNSTSNHLQPAISPHAPYSVSTDGYRQLVEFSKSHHLPLATHLAESPEEIELIEKKSGPLVDLFQEMGIWNPSRITTNSIREILEILSSAPRLLLIHCNYLQPKDWQFIRKKNPETSVVFCPKTHRYFGHSPHPFQEMQKDGLNIALGTDSRGSSYDLSMWEELKIIRDDYPTVSPKESFKVATIGGAVALGLQDKVGSLEPGKQAILQLGSAGSNQESFFEGLSCL